MPRDVESLSKVGEGSWGMI